MTDRPPTDRAEATARIDAILAALPDDQQAALRSLRELVAATAPEAEEAISYGVPAFRYHGRSLVGYAGAKAHCSFFPMSGSILDGHREALKAFDMAKGTVRFTPARPLPGDVVIAIVRERMAEIDAARR
ncbi:MAG: hypothetical protein A2Z32_09465 [Chloroflexi bacterium RBG_16_69_14]|nr:MAG: hypothetical protein A2Z32_09465 [Chloroflexi bacterium RBG_16_69_14]